MTSTEPAAALRIGFVRGVTLTKWRRIWAERYPRVPLDTVEVAEADQRRVLVDGALDMCFVRLPLERDGLHLIPLYEEQPVVWLSKDHALAELDELSLDDLVDDRVLTDADPESVDLASYSAAVLHVPLSVARSGSRRDMVHRPLVDAPTTTVGLAWRTTDDNPLLEEFIGVVRGRTPNSSRSLQQPAPQTKPAKAPKPPKAKASRPTPPRRRRGR